MYDKPFFEMNDWLDFLTYISVVLMPIFFILFSLISYDTSANEEIKYSIAAFFIVCYIPIYSPGNTFLFKRFSTFTIWCLGAIAIYLSFPLWIYPIYVICPILWYIRYSREKKHER